MYVILSFIAMILDCIRWAALNAGKYEAKEVVLGNMCVKKAGNVYANEMYLQHSPSDICFSYCY